MTTAAVRLGRFVGTRFSPPVYVGYAVLWTLSLESLTHLLAGQQFVLSGTTARHAVTVVLVLLFARMLDEQKDLDYDRAHHPDRPLVTGAVKAAELRVWMAVAGTGAVALNLWYSVGGAALAAVALAYCLGLAVLERRWARARSGVLTGLVLAYPAQLLLTVYLYGPVRGWHPAAVAVVFAGAFLQFELIRKISWHDRGERFYSAVLGPGPAALTALGCAAVASVVAAALCAQRSPAGWLLLIPLALPVAGTVSFFARRAGAAPLGPAMAFILGLYAMLIALGVLVPGPKGR
jgi:hypothetical protein